MMMFCSPQCPQYRMWSVDGVEPLERVYTVNPICIRYKNSNPIEQGDHTMDSGPFRRCMTAYHRWNNARICNAGDSATAMYSDNHIPSQHNGTWILWVILLSQCLYIEVVSVHWKHVQSPCSLAVHRQS